MEVGKMMVFPFKYLVSYSTIFIFEFQFAIAVDEKMDIEVRNSGTCNLTSVEALYGPVDSMFQWWNYELANGTIANFGSMINPDDVSNVMNDMIMIHLTFL
jgi:hypothetical protein